jgi:DNA-binding NarL/FixJ family response regulator
LARKRILLAEDHAEMAQRLQALLVSDYTVDMVSDGLALTAAADALVPDVIISDIMMHEMTGLDAARRILAARPDARIIFVSIRDEPAVIRKSLSEGALGYVVKCDAGEELSDAVETVLSGRRFLSSSAKHALDQSGGTANLS